MTDSHYAFRPWLLVGADEILARYRVEILPEPKVDAVGIRPGRGPGPDLLSWDQIQHAFAAEVGEPEGVRTVVFDLLVERKNGECFVYRFDADPCDDARDLAQSLVSWLGPERCCNSLRDLATDGAPTRRYPDLMTLTEATLESLGGV